jgi:PPM family protein phosphatase
MNTERQLTEKSAAERPAGVTGDSPESWTPLAVDLGAASHRGFVRENNEDHYLVMQFGRSLENLLTNLDKRLLEHSYSLTGYGMLVADGIGGMAASEVASGLALAKLVELLVDTPDWIMGLKREEDVTTVLQRMTQRFLQIDKALREKAKWDVTLRGMGTTLTVAGSLGSDLVIGHVGDSRAYLLRGANLTQLTTDHTLAQVLIDAGVADRDDPASRSMRHVLTAALGSLGERIEPQVQRLNVCPGDQLLLCTDGLTEMVDNKSIAGALRGAKSAQTACQNLVDLALAGGGLDNITVVLARFDSSVTTMHDREAA